MTNAAEPAGPDDSDGAPDDLGADAAVSPEQLLGAAKAARRQARRARHAYWFPLVLFGLLAGASVPFYIEHASARFRCTRLTRPPRSPLHFPIFRCKAIRGTHALSVSGPSFLHNIYLGGFGFVTNGYAADYWLGAMLVGLAATAVWYRLRGDRIGVRTPSRGFVITGLVLLLLALVIPVLADHTGVLGILMPGDLLVRGMFPLVLIGLGLYVLAWAERSVALTVISTGYLALSLVASLYDIENVLYRLHWQISPAVSNVPNVVLPALVLLLSGASAWVVQRQRRAGPAGPPGTGDAGGQPA
jgi:hypothetical protein